MGGGMKVGSGRHDVYGEWVRVTSGLTSLMCRPRVTGQKESPVGLRDIGGRGSDSPRTETLPGDSLSPEGSSLETTWDGGWVPTRGRRGRV